MSDKPVGLTEYGFKRPAYNELLDAYEAKAKELFGSGISLTSRSPLGIFLRLFAWFSSKVWETVEDTYNAGYVDTAAGVSLYRIGGYIGIRPLAAQKAIGRLEITGGPGTRVFKGFLARAGNNQRFVTIEDVTLDGSGKALVPIQAYVAGPDGNVGSGSITEIITPQVGVSSIANPQPTIGGRDRETDAEFRARYLRSVDIAGGSNTDAIRAELLRVEAVGGAAVFENCSDLQDANGLPPHAIECVVYGGYDIDVAQAIYRRKSAGIQTHGDTPVDIIDASGDLQTVAFSRPTPRPIWLKVSGLVTTGGYEAEAIRSALVDFIGDDVQSSSNGLPIGEDVTYNRLMCPLNELSGIVDYVLEVSVDGETWYRSNIEIGPREKAVTTPEKVLVMP